MSNNEFVVKLILFVISIPAPIIFVTSMKNYIQNDSKIKLFMAGLSLWLTVYSVVFVFSYIGTMLN